MKGDEAHREEEEGQPILEHEAVYGTVHGAVRSSQRQARSKHGTERRVEHSDELESHGERGDAQVAGLEPVGRLRRYVHLDDPVVRKPRQQRRLRADRDAVLRVELQLLLADLEERDLQVRLERALVREQHTFVASSAISVVRASRWDVFHRSVENVRLCTDGLEYASQKCGATQYANSLSACHRG